MRRRRGRARRALKLVAAGALHRSGALGALARIRLRGAAAVLTYHRVLPGTEIESCPSHPGIVVSAESFERQIRWIAKNLRPARLSDLVRLVREGRPVPSRTCLVTFDDGWRDNRLHALPVLRRHGVPAAVFLATGFVGTGRRFWQERLTLALAERVRRGVPREGRREDEALAAIVRDLEAGGEPSLAEIARTVGSLKGLGESERAAMIDTLSPSAPGAGSNPVSPPDFLDWNDVREMEADGFEFGAHGVDHVILVREEADPVREASESRTEIERRLGRAPAAFCYPNGDHDARVIEAVRAAGFEVAFATRRGHLRPGTDPYAIPRFNVSEEAAGPLPLYLARLAGWI